MSRAIASPVAISPRPERTRSAASLPKNELSSIFAPPCRHRSTPKVAEGYAWPMPVGRASDALLVNVSVTASGPRTRTFRLQLGDPAAVDGRHGEAEALHVDRVPDLRDAAQTAEDHPADGVVRLVGEIEAEPLARVGQRHEAVDEEGA